ncbi:MAG: SUF system NifU family Fe-S cluster assembly protein [Tetragenococcus sp.]|nr:SUF system NifU family Fe-S cluster assembly protein [Tetragenococcus sp.]MDN6851530.1 SUF system NifU family Fe-S cluster assembly protein [Tetragenococcus koreensis]
MALSKLENLYRQVILDHSSHPHNHGTLENSSQHIEMNNPTCGDVIFLELQKKDGIIKDIAFSGHGCSISTASASMMTEIVKGKTVEEAMALAEDFSLLVQDKDVTNEEELGEAEMLRGVSKFPARIKCATLSWKALQKAIVESDSGAAKAGFMKHDE